MSNSIRILRHDISILPESGRVIVRPFIPGGDDYIANIVGRVVSLSEKKVSAQLARVRKEFGDRHYGLESTLIAHYEMIKKHVEPDRHPSRSMKLLLGAIFSGEYALESAAIFNPSIVPHPDQRDAPTGGLRFILSLRATGEGHISSIEFRAGTITSDGKIELDPATPFAMEGEVITDPTFHRELFGIKLEEMGVHDTHSDQVLAPLNEWFTHRELLRNIGTVRAENEPLSHELVHTLECIQWLAHSNYELRFRADRPISERVIFPVSSNESNGIEDARFVRFVDEDGSVSYFATYTAYNGHDILPQLIETTDFLHFKVLTLNGDGVQNKGMALFPRQVGGRYAMLSRQDNENLFIMFSESLHIWSDPEIIMRPAAMWEAVKVGNCGSPVETEAGWLVITHGVGPMRKYCIGAILLDLEDPTKIIGRLPEPLLSPEGREREGYVPNVVYSCGSIVHGGRLILPYAVSDYSSAFATVSLDELLAVLLANPG